MAGLFWDLSKLRRDFYNINSTLMVASAHMHACVRKNYCVLLELRQYKNNFVSVKRMLDLKLSPFFPCHGHVGEGKRAAISKQTCFSQKRVRSYIDNIQQIADAVQKGL